MKKALPPARISPAGEAEALVSGKALHLVSPDASVNPSRDQAPFWPLGAHFPSSPQFLHTSHLTLLTDELERYLGTKAVT